MKDIDRAHVATALAAIATTRGSDASIWRFSEVVGTGRALLFVRSPRERGFRPAAGFPSPAIDARALDEFLSSCVSAGRHQARLHSSSGAEMVFTGLACDRSAVLVLGEPVPNEATLQELAGLLPLFVAAVAVVDERLQDNSCREISSAARDLERLREEAADAAKKKDEFLAAISHELRTPLNPVLLIASEAAENGGLPRTVRDDFATIARNAEIEARLIDDLLDITRITQGKMSLDKRAVDLRAVLQDAVATVRSRLDFRKIELVLVPAPEPHPIFGDAARLQQVFWNLLKSAVKFTRERDTIRVTSEIDPVSRHVIVHISNHRLPVSEADAKRVFSPASLPAPNHAAGRVRAGDLGIGMTISRMLVELHAGSLIAATRAPGRGATFSVKLPLAPKTPPASTYAPFETGPDNSSVAAPLLVLLVEDHEPTTIVLTRLLQRRGFAVVTAATVEAAKAAAEKDRFDFVVSDIGLPDGDGYALMGYLRSRHDLPGIAVSGYGMLEDIGRSEAAGFGAHLTKPVSVRALEAAVNLIRPALRRPR